MSPEVHTIYQQVERMLDLAKKVSMHSRIVANKLAGELGDQGEKPFAGYHVQGLLFELEDALREIAENVSRADEHVGVSKPPEAVTAKSICR